MLEAPSRRTTRGRPAGPLVPIRWRIFAFLFGIGFLEYLQQRGVTVAAAKIIPALDFSQMQIGWLEQAFVIGYALCQIPGGVLGQRIGARWTFVGVGAVSVLCIAATSIAPAWINGTALFTVMFAMQFLLGVAQAPTFPVSTGVFEQWFKPRSWALVQGLQTMGLGFGAALAPPLIAILMTTIGWQRALVWTAIPAIPLFILWGWYGRDTPAEHPSVGPRERALLHHADTSTVHRIPLSDLAATLLERNALLLAFSYFSMNYVFYLLGNWCFLYLVQDRHFSILASGWLAMSPPIAAGIGAGVGGALASALYARYGSRIGLRLIPLASLPSAGLLLLAAVHAGSAYVAIGMLTLCYGLVELTEGSYWAAVMTVGRGNTMAVGGVMNTGGSLGGVVGIPIVAYLTGHGRWNTAFLLGAGFALVSAIAWLFIETSERPARAPHPIAAADAVPDAAAT